MNEPRELRAECCIVGGGPAGIMLGYLLARAGVDIVILEKHDDFFRDFRGDTIHPSTLQVMDELGLLDAFLRLPHSEVQELNGRVDGELVRISDFRRIPGPCKFIAFMPQWDFLNFLAARGRALPRFHLRMAANVTDVLFDGARAVGAQATTPSGPLRVLAPLVVAADGRHSVVRERAGLTPIARGVPIDVLWLRVSRRPGDPGQALGSIAAGAVLVMLDRGTCFQCAFVIPKGGYERLRERGIDALRGKLVALAPFVADRVDEVRTWDDVKLLTVRVDRLPSWHRPGLLCIGDAAHAMSPIGGVGINLAIQDAVAAANILVNALRRGNVPEGALAAVQRRREFPTKVTQAFQVMMHDRFLDPVLTGRRLLALPIIVRVLNAVRPLRSIPAYFIGIGVRPEHVGAAIRGAAAFPSGS